MEPKKSDGKYLQTGVKGREPCTKHRRDAPTLGPGPSGLTPESWTSTFGGQFTSSGLLLDLSVPAGGTRPQQGEVSPVAASPRAPLPPQRFESWYPRDADTVFAGSEG